MKNVLIIVQHLYRGGAESSAAKLSVDLSEHYNVYLCTFFSEAQHRTTYSFKGNLICLNQTDGKNAFSKMVNFVKRVYYLRKIKRQYNIDYSISYLNNADFANVLSTGKEKVFVSTRVSFDHGYIGKLSKFLITLFYNRADMVLTQNAKSVRVLKEVFGVTNPEYKVIPNYYHSALIHCQAAEQVFDIENPEDYFILGQVARLCHQKGQWHLLRIFKEVRSKCNNARLFIVGEGAELHSYLLKYAEDLGLRIIDTSQSPDQKIDLEKYDVCFLGFQSNPHKYVSLMDVFAFTSLYEGFPNALAEAMICGKCVISTNCETGPQELLAPASKPIMDYPHTTPFGYLMPSFGGDMLSPSEPLISSELSWIDLIVELSSEKQQRLEVGLNAKKRMEEFEKDNVMKHWREILK